MVFLPLSATTAVVYYVSVVLSVVEEGVHDGRAGPGYPVAERPGVGGDGAVGIAGTGTVEGDGRERLGELIRPGACYRHEV